MEGHLGFKLPKQSQNFSCGGPVKTYSLQTIAFGVERCPRTYLWERWKWKQRLLSFEEGIFLMARNAKLVNDSVVWVEDTPPIIECQLIKDVTGSDFCPN